VDVWEPAEDGSEGDDPVIYHGRTLTTKLPLTKALVAIADYAFERSQYVVFHYLARQSFHYLTIKSLDTPC
jgi:hypothetical protein